MVIVSKLVTKCFNPATFAALILFLLVLLCSSAIYLLYHQNAVAIRSNEIQEKNRLINATLAAAGMQALERVKLATCDGCYQLINQQNKKKFLLLAGSARGYVAKIKLLLLLDSSGYIKALRVLQNQDTLGIGDRITKSGWLNSFGDKNIKNYKWDIRRHAGDFDHISGATITSRAALQAIGEIKQVFGGKN